MLTYCLWWLVLWVFPYLPLWFLKSMIEGEVASFNPLNWEIPERMVCSIWTISVLFFGAFIFILKYLIN